jgi:hypothetical protein
MKIFTKDLQELLTDDGFRNEHRGTLQLQHADIPYGYFQNDPADIPWGPNLIALVATASYDLATRNGTMVIKMGDGNYDMWRTAMQQAGWFVERDRVVLLQKVPWMKRKAWTSRSYDGVNAVHFWMICHKIKRDFVQSPKPFGTSVCVCVVFIFIFHFFRISRLQDFPCTPPPPRHSQYGRLSAMLQRLY